MGEILWIEFVRTFRSSTIDALPQEMLIKWINFYTKEVSAHVLSDLSRRKALQSLLSAKTFPLGSPEDDAEIDQQEE